MVHDLTSNRPLLLSTVPAEQRDSRLALMAVLFSVVIFIVAAPFARVPLPQVWAFIPVYQSALAINDLITAVLLFAQFGLLRSRALLVLSCAYLLTAVMAVLHLLTFLGLFSTTGLLGAGPQTTAWLYMFWHVVFPCLLLLGYALLRDRGAAVHSSGRITVVGGIAVVLAISCVLTMLATVGQPLLPPIMQGNNYTPVMIAVVSTVWILSVLALVALSMRRPHTKLDLWLMVVMCAWMFDVPARFSMRRASTSASMPAAFTVFRPQVLSWWCCCAKWARSMREFAGRWRRRRKNAAACSKRRSISF